jgi:ESX secretion system ATPase EccB
MPSRQDQLHSYQFMLQRVVAALVMRETDPAQSPFRRVAGATLVGVLLAALGLGAVAAYAVVSPGGSGKWRDEKAVIVEKESGALYVYRDARLHPVLNYTSALLVVNSPDARTVLVSRGSIADAPRGAPWGIVGAPASLPARGDLKQSAWTVCTQAGQSVLFVGASPPGGAPVSAKALLVSTSDGATYLLWKGHKHLVRQPDVLLPSLVWNKPPLRVARAFVNALPAGTDLARPVLLDRGEPALRPAGSKIGQVYFVERAGGVEHFVVLADGLASVTPLQAEMMLADPDSAALLGQRQPVRMERADFARLTQGLTVPPFAADPSGDAALPRSVPELADPPSTAVCAGAGRSDSGGRAGHSGTAGAVLMTDVPLPDLSGAVVTRATGAVLADRIVVPPGAGALVTNLAAPDASAGGLSLVTDLGMRYSLPSVELLPVLGYGGVEVVPLPAPVLALVPAGPALDPAATRGGP